MSRAPRVDPIVVKIGTFAQLLDSSTSTVRRLQQTDPDFPRPFRLTPESDWLWLAIEVRDYLARKVGRPVLGLAA